MYPNEKETIYCDYYNEDVIMVTEFSKFQYSKIPIKKRCSKWENCENREYCKYSKISK